MLGGRIKRLHVCIALAFCVPDFVHIIDSFLNWDYCDDFERAVLECHVLGLCRDSPGRGFAASPRLLNRQQ